MMDQTHINDLATSAGVASSRSDQRLKACAMRVAAADLLAILAAGMATVFAAMLLSGWPLLDRLLLVSAISAAAAAPWLYSTMIAGTKSSIQMRLALFGGVMLAAFTTNPEIVAVTFAIHSLAAVHAASGRRHRLERLSLLAWSGAAATLAVLCLAGLS